MKESKFNLIYEKILNELSESEQIINEAKNNNLIKRVGKTLAAGALAAGALINPVNVNAADTAKNEKTNSVEIKDAAQFIDYATRLLKQFEGSVKDSKGNHVVYDDADPDHHWDGKQNIDEFLKSCNGKPTIGYGETQSSIVKKGKISEAEANTLLKNQIISINNKLVNKFEKAYSNLSIVQKSVLISFYYNLGIYFKAPKMEAALRAGKLKEAAKEFLDCDNTTSKGVKKKNKGLTKRRRLEHNLFIQGLK